MRLCSRFDGTIKKSLHIYVQVYSASSGYTCTDVLRLLVLCVWSINYIGCLCFRGCLSISNDEYMIDETGVRIDVKTLIAATGYSKSMMCVTAEAARLRVHLKQDTEQQRHLAQLWLKKFLDLLISTKVMYNYCHQY